MKINLVPAQVSGLEEAGKHLAKWIDAVYRECDPSPIEGRFTKMQTFGVSLTDTSYITTLWNNFKMVGTFTYTPRADGGLIAASAWPELQRGQS